MVTSAPHTRQRGLPFHVSDQLLCLPLLLKAAGPFWSFFCFVLFLISTGKDWLIMRLTSISNQDVWGVAGTSFNWHANAPAIPVQSNQLGVYILLFCKALCEFCSWKVLYSKPYLLTYQLIRFLRLIPKPRLIFVDLKNGFPQYFYFYF